MNRCWWKKTIALGNKATVTCDIQMKAAAASLCFDRCKKRPLIPVRLAVIVKGQRLNRRGSLFGGDSVGNAHDCRGVHAAAQLGEDGRVRSQPPLDRSRKLEAKGFFVFTVGVVADRL